MINEYELKYTVKIASYIPLELKTELLEKLSEVITDAIIAEADSEFLIGDEINLMVIPQE